MKAFLAIALLSASVVQAENLYVTPGGGGTHDGTSWTNAFAGLANVAWGSGTGKVGAGDTLWIAGGTYSTPLTIGASGTALNRIQIKRVKADDAVPAAAPGWNPAFDAPAIVEGDMETCILFTGGVGSYVTIDGREEYGIRCNFKNGATGVEIDETPGTIDGITLQYIEAAGPGAVVETGDTRGFDLTIAGTITNLRVSHCSAHGCDTTFQISPCSGLIVEYCQFHDAYALNPEMFHPNTMLLTDTTASIIRFNRFYNIAIEGVFFESGNSDNVAIYGNVFDVGDVPPDTGRGIEFGSTAVATNFNIVNNTFVGLPFRALRLSGASHTGTVVKNNIFFDCVAELDSVTHDNNLFSGDLPAPEAHGIAHAPDPFVNRAGGDLHPTSTLGVDLPRNNGQALSSPFDVDPEGNSRGADGAWDIGAYEFTPTGDMPDIKSPMVAAGLYGNPFAYGIAASNAPTGFSLTGTLPPGLAFDAVSGTVSGTPTVPGSYELTVRASNASGTGAANVTFTIHRAVLGVTGITATNRTYNATNTATLNVTGAALNGVLPPDVGNVFLDTSAAAGAFGDEAVGAGRSVIVSGLTLTGPAADRYLLVPPTLSASIAPAPLVVAGISAASRTYNGTTAVTLSVDNASPVSLFAGDSVDFVSATGHFADPNAGTAKAVIVTAITLNGASAANYSPVLPTLQADILPANATVTLGNVVQAFDGSPKSVTVTTVPAGLPTTVTYSGSTTPPSAAGLYALVATITDPNYRGSATGVLNISGPAPPAPALTSAHAAAGSVGVTFSFFITATNSPASFDATGLPPGLSVNRQTGAISGVPTTTGTTAATVSATNAGGTASGPLTITIVSGGPSNQTVSFPPPAAPLIVGQPVTLNATASSGLPVVLSVISGNAVLSGNTITVYDTSSVVVRATQPGNGAFTRASADLTLANAESATPSQVFFGAMGSDALAATTESDNRSGTLLVRFSQTGEALRADLAIQEDGTFESTVSSGGATRTIQGRSWNGRLDGTVSEIGLGFSAAVQPPSGPTLALAGAYSAVNTASADGTTYLIVGTQGQLYAMTINGSVVTAGLGSVDAAGNFDVQTGDAAIRGTAAADSTLVSGTIQSGDLPPTEFAGGGPRAVRNQHLVNLSSRARVTAGGNGSEFIAGIVVGGSAPRPVLLRAVGPALTEFGIETPLPSPRLRLFDRDGRLVAENSGWNDSAETGAIMSRVGAFPLPPGSRDAALSATLAPGLYTMQVDGGAGVALAELYDAGDATDNSRPVLNISTRGFVDTGEGAIVAGLVVRGDLPARVLVRGVGPGLTSFGVPGVLADPVLQLFQGSTLLARNDNWESPQTVGAAQVAATGLDIAGAASSVGAFELAHGSKDAAIVIALAPGSYTAVLSGSNAATGAGLLEVYLLSNF